MGAVFYAINMVLNIYGYVLLARCVVSFLPVSRYNKAVDLLYSITEPVLAPIRNMLSRSSFMNNSMLSMMDFSPLVAFILIGVLRYVLAVVYSMFL